MPATCPDCGAPQTDDLTCQTAFDTFLSLEYVDPAYGAVHFLTVACFMIQHNRYSDTGIIWIQNTLREYLEKDLSLDQLRQLASQGTDSGSRSWKVTRSKDAAPLPKVAWSMTIIDVAQQYTDANTYRALITQWARTTLREMTTL